MPLDLSNVQAADIILTMGPSATSRVISAGTCGPVSHAILVLKNLSCIESTMEGGVRPNLLEDSLSIAETATLFRHKWITQDAANRVCHYAKQNIGKPYDKFGAIRSGVNTGCAVTKFTKTGRYVVIAHELSQRGKHDDKFFCSELVAHAFEKANIPITSQPYHKVTPAAILRSDRLTKIETLIS